MQKICSCRKVSDRIIHTRRPFFGVNKQSFLFLNTSLNLVKERSREKCYLNVILQIFELRWAWFLSRCHFPSKISKVHVSNKLEVFCFNRSLLIAPKPKITYGRYQIKPRYDLFIIVLEVILFL